MLGLTLEKSHSAADWSTRPLPEEWLRYAALDVEVLVELRDALAAQLDDQGKTEWAARNSPPCWRRAAPPRAEPWRRTSGIHRVRNRRGLAVVRELWLERDRIARRRDVSPTRVLPDAAIVEAARALPATAPNSAGIQGFGGRGARRHTPEWLARRRARPGPVRSGSRRCRRARATARRQRTAGPSGIRTPRPGSPPPGPPSPRWPTQHHLPAENLLPPTRCAGSRGSRPSRSSPRRSAAGAGRVRRPALAGRAHGRCRSPRALLRVAEKGEA